MVTVSDLRALAVSRSLFTPGSLQAAINRLGFVQADPIRAPARAQDLTLRHRVKAYRAGDLERRYPQLDVEEDVFVNYGFLARHVRNMMHPRTVAGIAPTTRNRRAAAVLAFVRDRGSVHPREVDAHFAPGRVTNYWGGSSSATTHLLEAMHYKGLLRVARRDQGIRVYAVQDWPARHDGGRRQQVDALVDVVVGKYAPLPAPSLSYVISRLRYAVPQWRGELPAALVRAKQRLAGARVDGVNWYWPADDGAAAATSDVDDAVRLLAPFDPVVWDRRRFELLWGWAYRFEAYTPVAKRKLGYYALPMLWRDRVIGWGNASMKDGTLSVDLGYVAGRRPRDRSFQRELDAEVDRLRKFISS